MTQSKIIQFGPNGRLVGVLSGSLDVISPMTLVLPSAGLLPRTGPFRLHVDLANRLATSGIRTFRFDVPGVGEAPRIDNVDAKDAILAAIEHLATHHGCKIFAVGGLCSAADLAWTAAIEDERVVAMLMLDGICFRGPWFYWAKLTKTLGMIPHDGIGMLRRWALRVKNQSGNPDDDRDWPSLEVARRQFSGVMDRGVHSLWIYTGGHKNTFRHSRQFRWVFGASCSDPRVTLQHWPDCDHLFYAGVYRRRLVDTVEAWLASIPETGSGLT